jgi:dipeptidase E
MNNQKIIAIGGGNFKAGKTAAIDHEILRSTGKAKPHMVFIPTASRDDELYCVSMTEHFTGLGCTVESLLLIKEKPSYQVIKDTLESADIIYVGGGNTLRMMNLWRKLGVDTLLADARLRGVVLCGVSAGSICWFDHGNSDSRKDNNPAAEYIKVTALRFIPALNCPHYDSESDRQQSLKKMTRRYPGVAIALTDCAALQVVGDTYRVIISQPHARAYKVYWNDREFYEHEIEVSSEFRPLAQLCTL